MKTMGKEEIEYYRKMSANDKLAILDDMFMFFRKAKKDHTKKIEKVKKTFERCFSY